MASFFGARPPGRSKNRHGAPPIPHGDQVTSSAAVEWTADLSQLFIGDKIASGSNSNVYRGVYKHLAVAVKVVRVPESDSAGADADERRRDVERQFNSEVGFLSRLRHPNVVRLVAACRAPPAFCVISEYMPRGTLGTYLRGMAPYSLSPETIVRLALDVARGMEFLHARGVIHRDLKSHNLLLDGETRVMVADLGTSCPDGGGAGDGKGGSRMGTYRWMAPEMIAEKPYTRKVDVYSFGVVLWELTTCLVPFQGMTPVQVAYAVSEKNARPPLSPACPPVLNDLIERCWAAKPSRRPEFTYIVSVLENFDHFRREGLPPLPSPSPVTSFLNIFKIRSCIGTNLPTVAVHA